MPELIRSPQVKNAVEETLQLSHPDAYQAELGAFLTELQKGCRLVDIDYVPLRTDQDLDVPLSSYLASRSARVR